MPEANDEANDDAAANAGPAWEDRWLQSVRLLNVAMVQLTQRPFFIEPPRRVAPEHATSEGLPQDEFRFMMVRKLSTWLGQPQRCCIRACRRTKVCHGDPPDCWRDEPPPTEDELAQAKAEVGSTLNAMMADRGRSEE